MNLKLILESQKQYFQSQSTRDIGMIKKRLSSLRVEILNREDEIYDALYKDFKKSKFETYFG
jgi:aldehyde dehydrogenase (NAD+)